jgi:hypothetical protein
MAFKQYVGVVDCWCFGVSDCALCSNQEKGALTLTRGVPKELHLGVISLSSQEHTDWIP